tara:strand:+ start:5491 stop:8352 length:2862 start_codon:yes stop_codon:yes gene_type:complete
MDKKKIFISYSWDSEEHKKWTRTLADNLEEHFELHITFDQYDLDSYTDKNHFMEKGVFDNHLVLVVVTPEYTRKANERSGGVGIETKLSSSRHWEESLTDGSSLIIPILRDGTDLPNYLKEKFYLDFRNDSKFESSFLDLLDHIKGTSRIERPQKRRSIHKKPVHKDLTKIEEFLKINHKKRRLVFDKKETTDYSSNNRIKFELWETKSPAIDYYLFIFDGVTLKPTVQRFCELIKRDKIGIKRLTVLRSNKGDSSYLRKLFSEGGFNFQVDEITFSDYIWDYCIDEDAKVPSTIFKQRFFIDQPLEELDELRESKGPAFDYLRKEFNNEIQSAAKVVIAPGGTGKTTLCQYVASEYQNPDSAVSVFIQSEELRENGQENGYDNIKIQSVYDLYEVYSQALSEQGGSQLTYDKTTFEVALITGRLVLVIDGMDEIISLFQGGFDIDLFLSSIEDLNKQLTSCKILITSRNDVFDLKLMEKYKNINKYYLLGFDEGACEKYLSRRFRNLDYSEVMKRKVLDNVKPLIDSDDNQRILPFVVDLLSTLAEDSSSDQDSVSIDLTFDGKKYESNEDITDYLVYSVLRREWQRQKINIPVEDVLEIFLEISSTHKDSFSKSDFEDVVSIFCSDSAGDLFSKMLRNPLIILEGDSCRFKYAFISDYFKSLYIINAINSNSSSEDFIKLIAKNAYGENEIMAGVCKYYSRKNEIIIERCISIIKNIKRRIEAVDVMSKNDAKFRAIAFLVKLTANATGSLNSKSAFTELLKRMFDNDSELKNLAIYGDSIALDLEGIDIIDSRFIGYKNFPRSKFKDTRINNCYFESCFNENSSDGFNKEIFDSCRLGDLEMAIEGAEEKSEKERELIENELRNFLLSFFKRGSFTDKKLAYIKMSTRIKSINRAFFNRLLKEDILQIKVEKADETYYVVSPHYEDSVYGFLSNNKIDRKIEKIIQHIEL